MSAIGPKEQMLRAQREARAKAAARPPVTESLRAAVTNNGHGKRGRPRKPNALTAAERQRIRRARLKAAR